MAEEVKEVKEKKKKELPIAQVTTCKSTQQMLRKAAEDGVEPWALAGFLPRIPMVRLASVVPA
jgi:hypothetical protein